jgi:hypothetical protein
VSKLEGRTELELVSAVLVGLLIVRTHSRQLNLNAEEIENSVCTQSSEFSATP